MHKKVVWINIKASNLGRIFLILAYISLILLVLLHANPLASGLVPFLLLHGWWSWRQAFGVAAPVALLIKDNELSVQFANGQLQRWKPPLLVYSRYCLVFKPSKTFALPWLLWPDAVSASEHHLLRHFLRGWR